jgi:zinc D-Ala-D-Ala dipeptidase
MNSILEKTVHEAIWVDLKKADPSVGLDIRYSTENNFLGKTFYPSPDAYLHAPVAEALLKGHQELKELGYGILIFDAYRPWSVTKAFWDLATGDQRAYLADPEKGSNHNRGCAVDCGLYEIASGQTVVMPSDFDEMNEKAWVNYAGGSDESRRLRDLLISTLERQSFQVAKNEWWHFNHPLRFKLPTYDLSFSEIRALENRVSTRS